MKKHYGAVALTLVTFLSISLITNAMNPIFPSLESSFNISRTMASFFPFVFFIAYGVMSIPAGVMTEKLGGKNVMIIAFIISAAGSISFAYEATLNVAMISLFCIGCSMALLQVVINPLLRVAGGEQHYAFYAVIGQLLFGVGGMITPLVYSYFVLGLQNTNSTDLLIQTLAGWVPSDMPWLSLYWLFGLMSALLLLSMFIVKLPAIELKQDERTGTISSYIELAKNKIVILYFFGIAAYVGTEVGIANSIGVFLKTYHDVDPDTEGARIISLYWTAMVIGCTFGMALMKLFDSRKVLFACALGAIFTYAAALFSAKAITLWALPMVGLFLSVMYPAIYSLALNSVKEHHGAFAGILCTAIIGGALSTPIINLFGELFDELRIGMLFIFPLMAYIASIGLWANPIIRNKTISFSILKPEKAQ